MPPQPPPPTPTTNIHDLTSHDRFILSDNPATGVTLRTDIGEATGTNHNSPNLAALTTSQLICLSLNEAARIYGVGKFFWNPSREERNLQKDQGYCANGPDICYIPWVWSDIDNHLYDDATLYQRLRMANAWTCLSPRDIVLSIFNNYKVETNESTTLPYLMDPSEETPFDLGTTSFLLLWDTHPNLLPRDLIDSLNLTTSNSTILPTTRHQHRLNSCDELLAKLYQAWKTKTEDGGYGNVSMEEVYADALIPGAKRDETLKSITRKSSRLAKALAAKDGSVV